MSEHLFSFGLVVIVQLVFFFIHAIVAKEMNNFPRYLGQGMLLGIPFGVAFDLVAGKYLGLFSYQLGFVWWFLIINGAISYGLMMANVLLMQHKPLLTVYGWSAFLGFVYELANWMFPVWQWQIVPGTIAQHVLVVGVIYFAGAWTMMLSHRLVFGTRFKLIHF